MMSLTDRTRTVVWAADGHPAVDADGGECVHVGHCQEEGGEALDFAADHPPQIALREAGGGGQWVAEDRNADVGDGEVEDEDVVRLDAQLPVAQEHHQRGSVASRCYETCRNKLHLGDRPLQAGAYLSALPTYDDEIDGAAHVPSAGQRPDVVPAHQHLPVVLRHQRPRGDVLHLHLLLNVGSVVVALHPYLVLSSALQDNP
ncbi:hypothetical protein C0Q70_11178 [Pomacea canaliculata]|uniref:Uncharacterized protein n=1 Tax=Pomacea canaliculata TaxID=400727 RepID=A0A2T7P591_POMCA|nr:hypothetical protein C0Q70_11178 [Pomacea canaliculata]